MTYSDIIKIITKFGWKEVRTCNSYHQFMKQNNDYIITIPYNESHNVSNIIIKNIESETGLSLLR